MKLVLAVLAISVLLLSETGFGPCLITGSAGAAMQAQKNAGKSAPAAASSVFVAEKGKFRIVRDGQTVGSEEFEIAPSGKDWIARGTTMLHPPGGDPAEVQATFRLAADGTPLTYDWSTKAGKKASAAIEFKNGVAKVSLNLEGATAPFVQELTFETPRIAVLDNNVYHHFAILARIYDWNTKGKQTFPVLIPQEITPGSIVVEDVGPQQVEGATLELLRVSTPDLEVQLFLDAAHKLARLAVPSSNVVVTRE